MTIYLADQPLTVHSFSADLPIKKPPISRSLDRLQKFVLARQQPEPGDRRSVIVRRTELGAEMVERFGAALAEAVWRSASGLMSVAETAEL